MINLIHIYDKMTTKTKQKKRNQKWSCKQSVEYVHFYCFESFNVETKKSTTILFILLKLISCFFPLFIHLLLLLIIYLHFFPFFSIFNVIVFTNPNSITFHLRRVCLFDQFFANKMYVTGIFGKVLGRLAQTKFLFATFAKNW